MDSVYILERLEEEYPSVPWADEKIRDKCRRMRRSVELSRQFLSLPDILNIHFDLYNHYPRLYYTVLEKDNVNWESQVEDFLKYRTAR